MRVFFQVQVFKSGKWTNPQGRKFRDSDLAAEAYLLDRDAGLGREFDGVRLAVVVQRDGVADEPHALAEAWTGEALLRMDDCPRKDEVADGTP
jgi:hypothetical protein